jgi:serine/threonine-protein kinase
MASTFEETRPAPRGLARWVAEGAPEPSAADARADDQPATSNVIHRFADQGEIGRGGMATVRRALDRSLQRPVAIKILTGVLPGTVGDNGTDKFVQEARITGQLEHPCIIPVHELGVDDHGVHYLCMKLVRGDTLEDLVEADGDRRLEPGRLAELLEAFLKVCDAVSFAHSRGVLHRDLKPANVMVGNFGEVYVLDWGVAHCFPVDGAGGAPARLCSPPSPVGDPAGAMVGTPAFMAPEQTQTDIAKVGVRTDVFGLGTILYFVLTGRPPFLGETIWMTLVAADECTPPSPRAIAGDRVPVGLEAITRKAMARDPADRYGSVAELRADVDRFLRGAWHLATRAYRAGEVIVREGEVGAEAFIIESGRCRVVAGAGEGRRVIRELGRGEVFGETAVLSAGVRTATVVAVDDVAVQVVTEESLREALGLSSWVGPFVSALADRFREVDARLRRLEGGAEGEGT